MPSHYDKGDYDSRDAGGGARYRGRGRGRGNYAWGGRVGNSGGRGYGRGGAGGGSGGGSRYRGGGGHGAASSSYRDTTASYHDRYSGESRRSGGHVVNPWDAGMGPREVAGGGYGAHATAFSSSGMGMESSGGGGGGAGSQLIGSLNQLSQMGNDKSKLALNILNAVLSTDSAVGEGRESWEHGPSRKMRRIEAQLEWDELRPAPARRYQNPRYSARRTWDRRGGGPSYPRGGDHGGSTDYQARRVAKARRGKPWHDTRSGKGRAKEEQDLSDDLERDSSAAGTSAAKAPKSSEGTKMEEGENKEAAEGKGKAEQEEDKEDKEGEEAEGATAAAKTDGKTEEKKDKDTETKQNEAGEITWLPREALQCHMCGLSKFPDIKSYMRHLESRRHETLKYSFHAKGAAILHFLRANSKLASQRKMLKSLRRGTKGPIMRCRKCQCEVFGYIREHAKTVEHIALRNYLRVVCCDTTFFNRADLEEHRLSLIHLKNQLEEEQRRQKMEAENQVEDIGVEENEEGTLFAETVKHMKHKTQSSDVDTSENVMPYDPAVPTGLNFIWKRAHYRCKACPRIRLTSAADTEEHFKSLDHYNNLMVHIKAIEEEKEKKRLEEEEEARKAEVERKKKEEAEAKAAEEAEKKEGEDKEEEEEGDKDADGKEAKKDENDDSKKNGDLEKEDEAEDEEEEEATTATQEEDEDASFNFEDMDNMETVDEACDDGELEGGLEGSLAEEEEAKGEAEEAKDKTEEDEDTKSEAVEDISCLEEVGEELEEVSKKGSETKKKGKGKEAEVKEEEKPKVKEAEKPKVKEAEEKPKVKEEEKPKVKEAEEKPKVKEAEEKPKVKEAEEKPKVKEAEEKPKVKEAEEKPKVKESDKDKEEEKVEESKPSAKRAREEEEEPAVVVAVAVEGRGRGSTPRGTGAPRARRSRGRGRARAARN